MLARRIEPTVRIISHLEIGFDLRDPIEATEPNDDFT